MSDTVLTKPLYNVKKLTMWQMTDETEETYGDVLNFVKRLMNFRDSISSNNVKIYGDGEVTDTLQVSTGGDIELGIQDLSNPERVLLYGEKVVNGANVTGVDDSAPYVAVALATDRTDKKINLYKWFKVKFAPHEENVTQRTDNPNISTPTIRGSYIPNKNGILRATRRGVDPVADAELISKWFSDADYIGEEESDDQQGG